MPTRGFNLMFASEELESRFRTLIIDHIDEEIGGFVFCRYLGSIARAPVYGKDNKRAFIKAIGREWMLLIESWIIVPNRSENSSSRYMMGMMEETKEIAQKTARSLGQMSFHFHSHPRGFANAPSPMDAAFWLAHQCAYVNTGEGVIATGYPLRVIYHFAEHRPGESIDFARGEFFSWREKRFRQIKQGSEKG